MNEVRIDWRRAKRRREYQVLRVFVYICCVSMSLVLDACYSFASAWREEAGRDIASLSSGCFALFWPSLADCYRIYLGLDGNFYPSVHLSKAISQSRLTKSAVFLLYPGHGLCSPTLTASSETR